jgi:hypothetical protein
MFQLFKSKEDTIKELESQINTDKYKLVQGRDGTWSYKIWFCNEWVLQFTPSSDKIEVIKWILERQQADIKKKEKEANFS